MTRKIVDTARYTHHLDENGDLESSVPHVRDGRDIVMHDNGFVAQEIERAGGKRNGVTNYYAPDGLIQASIPYRDNELKGIGRYYTPEGRIAALVKFDANRAVEKREYHDNGKRKNRTILVDEKPDNAQWHYDESGALVRETMWKKGVRVFEVPVVNGLYEGIQTVYSEQGEIVTECPWQAGKREGMAVQYGPNGSYFEQEFKNDRKIGPRVGCDAMGKITSRQYADRLESYQDDNTTIVTPLNKQGEMSGLEQSINFFSDEIENTRLFVADEPSDVLAPKDALGKAKDLEERTPVPLEIINPDAVAGFNENNPSHRVLRQCRIFPMPDVFSKS